MSEKFADALQVRPMRADEIAMAVDWAAVEGWNPGLSDAHAVVSAVNYDDSFAFLGFFIVRPELRGHSYGMQVSRAALAHAGARTMGLDGVVEQQDNYAKSGFARAYNNIRYGGVPAGVQADASAVPLSDIPFDMIVADDARVFPARRPAFWKAWLGAPGHRGCALIRDGSLVAWGVIRPCRKGRKIGPLIAGDREAAEVVFAALVGDEGGEVFLDVPQPNAAASALATGHGLTPVFETARMYSGPIRNVALERVFGVTTFELG
jgi:hypothetical protein